MLFRSKLSFGGAAYSTSEGIELDWIVREDEYRALYEEALDAAKPGPAGYLVVPAEYLAAMKLATLRPRDYEDLMYLLGEPGVVDLEKAKRVVFDRLGGRFALDQFLAAAEEATWRRSRDQGA